MAEDSEDQFDEDDYRTVLRTGGRRALVAANEAFGKLGFKANFTMVASSVLSLEYPPGDRFSPVRILHHSKHINTFLKGRETQLPVLHSVMLSSGYETPAAVESTGASLTSTQLVFELLKAIDAGVRDWQLRLSCFQKCVYVPGMMKNPDRRESVPRRIFKGKHAVGNHCEICFKTLTPVFRE